MRVGRRRLADRRFSIAHGLAEGGAVRVGRLRFADRPLLRYTRS